MSTIRVLKTFHEYSTRNLTTSQMRTDRESQSKRGRKYGTDRITLTECIRIEMLSKTEISKTELQLLTSKITTNTV